jgi:GAF domain-containing protein
MNGSAWMLSSLLTRYRSCHADRLCFRQAQLFATGMNTQAQLERQNERLQLLLNLTTRITSNLDLREVLRAIAANIREVIHADAVVVSLPDPNSGSFSVFAMDFPQGKGILKEELLFTPGGAGKRALDTLTPVVIDAQELDRLSSEMLDIVAVEGIKAFCGIPLVNRGRVLGILSICRRTETPFTPEDVDFLSRLEFNVMTSRRKLHSIARILLSENFRFYSWVGDDRAFDRIAGADPLSQKNKLNLRPTSSFGDSPLHPLAN